MTNKEPITHLNQHISAYTYFTQRVKKTVYHDGIHAISSRFGL